MRALITGCSGFVGSHLADYLTENTDWDIYGMCRWRSPLDNLEQLMPRINAHDRMYLVYADLRDTLAVQSVVREARPDFVFHLAAQSFPRTSFESPLDTIDTNVNGTTRLLEALRQYTPEALIHVCSSSEIFGRVPKERLPIDEDCPFHPASPYAISKAGTDLLGRFYAEAYGMHVQVTRMFSHSGARRGDCFAESSFAKQIAMIQAGMIPPIIRHGNLDSLRTYADVRDAVRAYHMLLTVNPVAGAYYNIGGDTTMAVRDILKQLISLAGRLNVELAVDPNRLRPIDADLQVPDTTKFRAHTGWKPEIPFAKTLGDLLDYWRHRIRKSGAIQR